MDNDGVNFAISTGGGFALWLATAAAILPVLWCIYVTILIAIKLPVLYRENPVFRRAVDGAFALLRRVFKGRGHGR